MIIGTGNWSGFRQSIFSVLFDGGKHVSICSYLFQFLAVFGDVLMVTCIHLVAKTIHELIMAYHNICV